MAGHIRVEILLVGRVTLEGFLVSFSLMSLQSPVDAITVLRQFPFSSGLQRMSVIAQLAGDLHLQVYMKGAPEMVARFCRSETGTDIFVFQEEKPFQRPNLESKLLHHCKKSTWRYQPPKPVKGAGWFVGRWEQPGRSCGAEREIGRCSGRE